MPESYDAFIGPVVEGAPEEGAALTLWGVAAQARRYLCARCGDTFVGVGTLRQRAQVHSLKPQNRRAYTIAIERALARALTSFHPNARCPRCGTVPPTVRERYAGRTGSPTPAALGALTLTAGASGLIAVTTGLIRGAGVPGERIVAALLAPTVLLGAAALAIRALRRIANADDPCLSVPQFEELAREHGSRDRAAAAVVGIDLPPLDAEPAGEA